MALSLDGGAVGQSLEERRRTVAELSAVFRETGFPFHCVPLEQVSVDTQGSAEPQQPLAPSDDV